MNLNSIESAQVREFLLKLVQVLTPLAEERPWSASFFLNRRFFIPVAKPPSSLQQRHPVQLLTTLQKQVEEFLTKAPGEEKPPQAALRPEAEEADLQKQPIAKQAKELIGQVQKAIGVLAASPNMKNLKEEPLRETLKKLKPHLDRIVEAISQEKEASLSHPSNRFLALESSREHLFKKLAKKEGTAKEQSADFKVEKKRPSFLQQKEKEVEESAPRHPSSEKREKASVQEKIGVPPETPSHSKNNPSAHRLSEQTSSAAIAPFVSETKSSPHLRKKKRKGFWFRDEPEDPPHHSR